MEREQLERAIEAILFAAGERVDAARLAWTLETDTASIMEIADALAKSSGIKLDKRKIVISDTIKNVGTYTVTCKLGYEITAPLTVKIEEA